jgi:hypothetical protein
MPHMKEVDRHPNLIQWIHSVNSTRSPIAHRQLELMRYQVGSDGGTAARIRIRVDPRRQSLPALRAAEPRGERCRIGWIGRFFHTFRAFPHCGRRSRGEVVAGSPGLADFLTFSEPRRISDAAGASSMNSILLVHFDL